MKIRTTVKNLVRDFVGTRELGDRLHVLDTAGEKRSAACEAALAERVRTLEDLLLQRDAELSRACALAVTNTIMQANEEAFFRSDFNDVEVSLPRDTIRTMFQCVHGITEGPLLIRVEEAHRKWMMSHLSDGGTFLDVGAATGAMTIPITVTYGPKVRIVAFEPARRARRLLELTLERNGLTGVEVIPKAISNIVGEATFSEYGFDETGITPFLPEGSALHSHLTENERVVKYGVKVTTLDAFCSARGPLSRPTVIKIDVEGFEALVLEGASALISSARPWFSIDIHADPFDEGTTEGKVRAILGGHGYRFETMAHVLLASPK